MKEDQQYIKYNHNHQSQKIIYNSVYLPIITIYDTISNIPPSSFNTEEELSGHTIQSESIPEILLLSGLDYSMDSIDIMAPSGIYSTLRLLLDCAICESLR